MTHWKAPLAALLLLPPAALADELEDLYDLDRRLIEADARALIEIAPYLDSDTIVTDTLGHHIFETTEADIARRILSENTSLTESELATLGSPTTAAWLAFLETHPLHHSALADTFLHTPIAERDTVYQLELMGPSAREALPSSLDALASQWLDAPAQQLLDALDPQVLLKIAAMLYQDRHRWNRYQYSDEDLIAMLHLLTHTSLLLPGEDGELKALSHQDFDTTRQLNALIYWATHHDDYRWSDEAGHFVNVVEPVGLPGEITENIHRLTSPDAAVAQAAYRALAESDPDEVRAQIERLSSLKNELNRELGLFPFEFLRQIPVLTAYCREHGHSYQAAATLQEKLAQLRRNLPLAKRYALEDEIIASATLDDLTAIELDILLKPGFQYTHSVGRILDKGYSRLWSELAADEERLKLYLVKSRLFDDLGIIGFCNLYLRKFRAPHPQMAAALGRLETDDPELQGIIDAARAQVEQGAPQDIPAFEPWAGRHSDTIDDPGAQLATLPSDTEGLNAVINLVALVRYEQLDEVLPYLERHGLRVRRDLSDFIESDFGIPLSLYRADNVGIFVRRYHSMTEAELYRSYLTDLNPAALHSDGRLNHAVIDDMLAFDSTTGFIGGGGGDRDSGIYLAIKLLELEHGETLGYPDKRCNGGTVYGCSTNTQARAWRRYLAEEGLVTPDPLVPPSFSHLEG